MNNNKEEFNYENDINYSTKWQVYNTYTDLVYFTGTSTECENFIKDNDLAITFKVVPFDGEKEYGELAKN